LRSYWSYLLGAVALHVLSAHLDEFGVTGFGGRHATIQLAEIPFDGTGGVLP